MGVLGGKLFIYGLAFLYAFSSLISIVFVIVSNLAIIDYVSLLYEIFTKYHTFKLKEYRSMLTFSI